MYSIRRCYSRLNVIEKVLLIFTALCFLRPLTIPNLYRFGSVEVQPTYLDDCPFLNAHQDNLNIEPGGRYSNRRCKHRQEVAIVVPYRNRSEHLTRFLSHLHPFLVNQNRVSYQIFIIEQADHLPFNRGRLLNIGFREALRLNPSIECFVFHDVDIVPTDIRQLYTCSASAPRHLCSYLDKFRYVLIYPNLFGGVIALRTSDFRVTNGYSNLYSGWGGEDDDFYKRVRRHFDHIERFDSNVGRCIMFSHQQYEPNTQRASLLATGLERADSDGLTNLDHCYRLVSTEQRPLYTNIAVQLTACAQQQQQLGDNVYN